LTYILTTLPNGYKILICLEELKIPYTVKVVDVRQGEQFQDEFLALNPNAKVPVIVDHDTGQTLFESCAILLYLADKAGQLVPSSGQARWEAIQWLFFQAASVDQCWDKELTLPCWLPKVSLMRLNSIPRKLNDFMVSWKGDLKSGNLSAMNTQLWISPICDEYSIVDIAHWGWLYTAKRMGFSFDEYRSLSAWHDRIAERPAVAKGITVPAPLPM
jgi:GST-like protein